MENQLLGQLLQHNNHLLAYTRSKVNDPTLAEDVLQESLLKALAAAPDLRDQEKLLPWFYSILNNAITDLYRRQQVETRSLQQIAQAQLLDEEQEIERVLCECFRALIPTLKPEYGELIEQLELSGSDPAQVAERIGITANNLKVRRHRARQALRQRLEESCRVCAKHGCLDCTCARDHAQHEATSHHSHFGKAGAEQQA
jgi:RNA polymerase sigma-70 factor (ECF subfamily)